METITWVTQENGNHLLQLPSCSRAVDGFKSHVCQGPPLTSPSHRELMGCQSQLVGSNLLFIMNCRAHCMQANQQPFLGKLLLGWGSHRTQLGTGLTHFHIQNCVCYDMNLSGLCTSPGHEAIVFPGSI